MSRLAILVLLAATGCGATPRFKDQPVVWRVGDARHIDEPAARPFQRTQYYANIFFRRRVQRLFELPTDRPAKNTNALDEVPDSTWFQGRIGARPLAPGEAALGPTAGGDPLLPPLRVVAPKEGGGNPGFVAEDAGGRRHIVKFDKLAFPEMATTAGVVVNRFFWAIGYHVPADRLVRFRRDELVVPPGLAGVVDAALATAPRGADGAYRAIASELLPGVPKGGWSLEGTRADDPNDRVRHEDRRELRALRVFAAWLGHTDVKADNTLDMYVTEGGRRFLRHYLVDFGEALGAHAAEHDRQEDGWEHFWDWEMQTRALLSFGLWRRPWEDLPQTRWKAIGGFSADGFDPRRWREAYPYFPFFHMDAADAFWAAKIVMRFDRSTIAAIVAEAQLADPEAADYLVDTLAARRDAVGRAYLDAVTPVDELRVEGAELCMVDVAVRHGLVAPGVLERVGGGGGAWRVATDGWVCVPLPGSPAYTVLRLRMRRGDEVRPPVQVHLLRGRVIGLVRET
jgi:hypothetical protein